MTDGRDRSSLDIHPRVAVSETSSRSWSLEEDLSYWSSAEIRYVGIRGDKLEKFGWELGITTLDSAELRIADLFVGSAFHLDRPQVWDEERLALKRGIDAAVGLKAECLFMTAGPPGKLSADEAVVAFNEAIAPVREMANRVGMPMVIEHHGQLRRDLGFIHTLEGLVEFAEEAELDICVELNNCWVERNLARTFRRGMRHFQLVQVSDFVVGTLDTPNRVVPGDGDIPLERLISDLLDAGYEGPFEIEIVGPCIDAEGYVSAIGRSARWLSDVLDQLGA